MKANKINEKIFNGLIKRGYSSDDGVRMWNLSDPKLWFLTPEQSQAFLDLEKTETHQKKDVSRELKLIQKHLGLIDSQIKDEAINVVDIGCGDGKKAAEVIRQLKNHKTRYCPIDISSYMIKKAIDEVKTKNPEEVIKLQWIVSDFDNLEQISKLVRYKEYQKNLFLLLGDTLENFEIHEFLYNVRNSMNEGDVLLVGDGLDTLDEKEILSHYKLEKVHTFLKYLPLGLGFKENEVELEKKFVDSHVEISYRVKIDKVIESRGRKVEFKKGDKLLIVVSYKYEKEQLESFFKMYFNSVEMFLSDDNSYALTVCKK